MRRFVRDRMSIGVISVLSFVFLLGLVSISSVAGTVKNPNTIVSAETENITTLDPAYAYNLRSMEPIFNVYDRLLKYKGGSLTELEPMLATVVPSKANGLITTDSNGVTYIDFPIRQNVKFHNGDILTPGDVKYSFLRLLIADQAPAWLLMQPLTGYTSIEDMATHMAGVKDFAEVDNSTLIKAFDVLNKAIVVKGNSVEFRLPKPFPPFLQIICGTWASILDKNWVIAQGGWPGTAETWKAYHGLERQKDVLYGKMNGTGPFELKNWDRGVSITLTRFNDYWAGPAKIENVLIKRVNEWTTRKMMLQSGDVDFADVPSMYLSQIKGMKGIRITYGLPEIANYALAFQFGEDHPGKDSPFIGSGKLDGNGVPVDFFNNIDVRKAFCYAFDYKTYIDQVVAGHGIRTNVIPKGLLGYDPKLPQYTYDPSKATQYFKKAYDGKLWKVGFKFIAGYNAGNDAAQAALQILQQNLLKINPKFKLDIQALQWSTYLDKRREFPLCLQDWWLDYPDPHNFAVPWMASYGSFFGSQGSNAVALAKKEFDPLIKEAVSTYDSAKRVQIYKELQQLAYDYAIDIFLHQPITFHVERDWVKGWYYNPVNPGYDFYAMSK